VYKTISINIYCAWYNTIGIHFLFVFIFPFLKL